MCVYCINKAVTKGNERTRDLQSFREHKSNGIKSLITHIYISAQLQLEGLFRIDVLQTIHKLHSIVLRLHSSTNITQYSEHGVERDVSFSDVEFELRHSIVEVGRWFGEELKIE